MMNILLVGLGGMGNCHYRNYQHIDGVKVSAVVGFTEADKAAAAQWGVPLFPTITEACLNAPVDLVDVCTPTYLHKSMVLEAISMDRHVIVEKPVALSLEDAELMYQAAEGKGVQLYVAQVLQFTREVEALREVVHFGQAVSRSKQASSGLP